MNSESTSSLASWLATLVGVGAILAIFHFYPLRDMTPVPLGVMAGLLSWLVYQYLEPIVLVRRHAFLAAVAADGSLVRRILWKGSLLKIGLAFAAGLAGLLALLLNSRMGGYERIILWSSLPAFVVILAWARRTLGNQFEPQYRFAFSLRAAYWLTLVLMVLALVAWQIFLVEVPVTSHLEMQEVLAQAFAAASSESTVSLVGWLLGIDAGVSAAGWHLMQVTSAEALGSRWAYLAGCAIFLGWSALKFGTIWLVLLGIITLAFRQRMPAGTVTLRAASRRAVVAIGVALLVAFAGMNMIQVDTGPVASAVQNLVHWRDRALATVDPCLEIRGRERRAVSEAAARELDALQGELERRIIRIVHQRIEAAYASAEQGVDEFLDWNFSLEGQYAQLGYLAASATASGTFEVFMAKAIDERVHAHLSPGLEELGGDLESEFAGAIKRGYHQHHAFLAQLLEQTECIELPNRTVSLDDYMNKSLVGAGAGAGVLSARTANQLGAKMVGRSALKRVIAGVTTRAATRTASTIKGGLIGLACGPVAPVCIVAIAGAAWIGTDLLINAADEALNRDDMRADMLGVLSQEKDALNHDLVAAYLDASQAAFDEMEQYQAARFNIYRDGG
jgi:hypothetical protein